MKQKIAAWIVSKRTIILLGMALLSCACLFTVGKTRINYDLTRYLDENTMTRRALEVMEAEFGSSDQVRVMFQNQDGSALARYAEAMEALPQVRLAHFDPEESVRREGDTVYQLVTLVLAECDEAALVRQLRQLFPDAGPYAVGGAAAALLDVQESVGAEIPAVMAIAVAVVLLVLLVTSHAWLEPAVILIVLAVSILINMGTNFIFPDVSFITFAVCAILQLALSIDYAIMLLHAYNGHCDAGLAPAAAMEAALAQSFMPVSSSAMTTAAGLLSLLFMSFTIGFDIGLVLTKGILISMLCVFLLMPSVTLLFFPALGRTRHRPLRLGGEHLARLVYRARRPLAGALVLMVGAGFFLQNGNTYLFTDSGQTAHSGESERIERVFGASNPIALMVPGGEEDADYARQRALADKLAAIRLEGTPALKGVSAMVTDGAEALRYYTPQDVADLTGVNPVAATLFFRAQGLGNRVRADRLLEVSESLPVKIESLSALRSALAAAKAAFVGPRYARLLLEMNFGMEDPRLRPAIDAVQAAARELYGDDYYLTGIPMSTYDIGNAFEGDLMKVNLITFFAILFIVACSFRALSLPALLVLVIEGAIWITMGVSRLLGQPIFFMSYLICVSIQMGATIDYGILLSSHYRNARLSGLEILPALESALKRALPTVLTSGIILITAGYVIGKMCSVYYIYAIGLLLSRGAAISVFLVLTLLPALLALGDRLIIHPSGRNTHESV